MVQALGFPHRLRDQVIVEVGPTARSLDGHVAALDALVKRGQQRYLIMRSGDCPFLTGACGRLQDVAPPTRGQET